jgi:hypothetical protein
MTNVVLTFSIYLLTCASSVSAVALGLVERPHHLRFSAVLAFAAILVSSMAVTAWTPFGVFPEFGYGWSNGPIDISVRSGWLFVIPLVLATLAALLAFRNYRRQHDAA